MLEIASLTLRIFRQCLKQVTGTFRKFNHSVPSRPFEHGTASCPMFLVPCLDVDGPPSICTDLDTLCLTSGLPLLIYYFWCSKLEWLSAMLPSNPSWNTVIRHHNFPQGIREFQRMKCQWLVAESKVYCIKNLTLELFYQTRE